MVSSSGHFEIVKLLLDKGAEVNHQNKVSYSSIVVFMFNEFLYLILSVTSSSKQIFKSWLCNMNLSLFC